jgi:chromosome partitioning protein
MAYITLIASQKGGVGKTTTALNLGFALARFDERVLVIDADPQGSLAIASSLRKKTGRGIAQLLAGECGPADVVHETRFPSLSLAGMGVCGSEEAMRVEEAANRGELARVIGALAEPFRYVVIDAPSGIGTIVASLLGIAHGVVLPVLPRALTLRTLPAFLKAVQRARANGNRSLRIEGVVVTMFRPDSPSDARSLEEIRALFPEDVFFHGVVPAHDAFEQASLESVPVALLPGGQKLARTFSDLALDVQERATVKEQSHAETRGLF